MIPALEVQQLSNTARGFARTRHSLSFQTVHMQLYAELPTWHYIGELNHNDCTVGESNCSNSTLRILSKLLF